MTWKVGQRVGVGWLEVTARSVNLAAAETSPPAEMLQIPGIVYDGGYAEYIVTPAQGLAKIPDALSFIDAAPLLCAGLTTFNALRHSGAMPGDLVAIQGLGGLGHLGIQYANKMGFETVAIGRGDDKKDSQPSSARTITLTRTRSKPAEALQKIGGAKTILATAPDSKSMTLLIDGLGVDGTLMVVGVDPGNIEVSPLQIVTPRRGLRGWPSGTAADSEDAMRLAALAAYPPDDRNLSLGRSRRRVRPNDERQSPLPRRPKNELKLGRQPISRKTKTRTPARRLFSGRAADRVDVPGDSRERIGERTRVRSDRSILVQNRDRLVGRQVLHQKFPLHRRTATIGGQNIGSVGRPIIADIDAIPAGGVTSESTLSPKMTCRSPFNSLNACFAAATFVGSALNVVQSK